MITLWTIPGWFGRQKETTQNICFTCISLKYHCKIASPFYLRSIFIIDHAWTYRASEARQCLMEIPGLLERMASLMNITDEGNTREQFVEKVMQEMWKYNNTYSVGELPQ